MTKFEKRKSNMDIRKFSATESFQWMHVGISDKTLDIITKK